VHLGLGGLGRAAGVGSRLPELTFRKPVDSGPIICVFDDLNCATQALYHAALDFGGSLGDPVRAAADGVVAKIIADDGVHDHGFGNTVILRNILSNGDPIYSLYAHLDSFDAGTVVGACISEGNELGKMGGSGLGDEHHWPPHVHFELKLKATLRNPVGPGPWWGYLPGSAENYGYFNPADYVDQVTSSAQCAPSPQVSSLKQFDSATSVRLPFGAVESGPDFVASGGVKGYVAGSLWLLVEVRRVGVPFTGEPTCASGGVRSGRKAKVLCAGLSPGAYHWQARAEDSTGARGPWLRAGGSVETNADFVIADRTPPVVSVVSVDPATIGVSGSVSVTWHADENGSFTVRAGGSDCSSGTEVASGDYTSAPGDVTAQVDAAALTEGPNTVRACVSDAAGNVGSAEAVVTKDSSPLMRK
jgi:hypothetical protein